MKAFLKRLLARYTVSVVWEGQRYTHLARSLPDAFEWLCCYPANSAASVHRNLTGQLVHLRSITR